MGVQLDPRINQLLCLGVLLSEISVWELCLSALASLASQTTASYSSVVFTNVLSKLQIFVY